MAVKAGKMVIFSGPSGAGKTTVVREVLDKSPLPLELSVSATTRPPRPGEEDGIAYYFLSHENFMRRRVAGEFLESAEVFGRGYWYGTLHKTVCSSLDEGKWVVLEIDVQGMQSVVQAFPHAITVFVRTDTLDELERRLRNRGTETEETIQRRLEVARHEWQFANVYKYNVVNDILDRAVNGVCQILQAESEAICSKN